MNKVKEITGLDTIDELLGELQSLKEEYNLNSEMIEDIRQRLDYMLELELMILNPQSARKNIMVYNSKNIKRLKGW